MVISPTARVNFAPVLSSVAMLTNGQIRFTITWMNEPVLVQASEDLVDWLTLTNRAPSIAATQFTNTNTNLNWRFYRAVARP